MFGFEDEIIYNLEAEIKALKAELSKVNQAAQPLIEAITRRMKSDDACGHPFDEVLGEALNEYKKAMET